MKKIVFLEPLGIPTGTLAGMAEKAAGPDADIVCYDTRREDAATLAERSSDADAVVLSNLRYPEAVMRKCPRLEYICVAFTGYEQVDMAYCRRRGIRVSNCSGYATAAVADLVFGLVLGLYRRLADCGKAARSGGTGAGLIGSELEGKKFGIVGAGAIGLRVAKIARAFGCEVLAYSRTAKKVDGVRFVGLGELLKTCDVVSLHVPLTAQTAGLIGRDEISKMKKSAVLINTARGPVVDSAALADALNRGSIAGAAVDVFETEPPIDRSHPLLTAKNCLVTPHIGFATKEAMRKRAEIVCSNLRSYLAGSPENLVE